VDERRGVDELHDRGVQHRLVAGIAAQTRRHEQHRRPDALAAALLDVFPHLGDERHARLNVPRELVFDTVEIGADRLEDLRQVRRHGEVLRGVTQRMGLGVVSR
jgi:hypothetical protein